MTIPARRPEPSLSTREPREVHGLLADAFNAADLEATVALYDPEAVLVPWPGALASGPTELRAALAGYLAIKPRGARVDTVSVVVAGEIALTRSDWRLEGNSPADDTAVQLHHFGAEVVRRQADGRWLFLIDDPFAADGVAADPAVDLGPDSPSSLHGRLQDALNAADLDATAALYDPGATLVAQPGKIATGVAAVRESLAGFIALRPRNTRIQTLGVVRAGDLAFTRSHWTLEGTVPGQGPISLDHHGFEVMRRAPDGTWRFLIDDPYAGDDAAERGRPRVK